MTQSRIYQPSVSVGDIHSLTISMWFNLPSGLADGTYRLLEFGGSGVDRRRSFIDLIIDTGDVAMAANFYGPVVEVDEHVAEDWSGPFLAKIGHFIRGTMAFGIMNYATFFDAWHHLVVPIDVSSIDDWLAYPVAPSPTYLSKGIFDPWPLPELGPQFVTVPDQSSPVWAAGYPFRISDWGVVVPHPSTLAAGTVVNASDSTHSAERQAAIASVATDPKFAYMRLFLDGADRMVHTNANLGPPYGFDRINVQYDGEIGGSNYSSVDNFTGLAINGSEFGIPIQATDWISGFPDGTFTRPMSAKHRYADIQIWLNKYIDPADSANFSKLVNIKDGRGYPQKPSVAAAAFGEQTFLFSGKGSAGVINRGTGGAFLRSGQVNDFAPTPSDAPY